MEEIKVMDGREKQIRQIFNQLMSKPYTVSYDWAQFYDVVWEGLKGKKYNYTESFLREFWIFMPRYDINKYQKLSKDFEREMEN